MTYTYRPNAVIEIAGQSLSAAEAGLQNLSVNLGLNRHGSADLTVWPGSKFANVAEGDAIKLAIGPVGDEIAVMTGQISARQQMSDRIVLEALDQGAGLSRKRTTITFEESKISDIVTRLADENGMTSQVDGSDTLSIYYILGHRPLWDHLRDLARLTGHDLSVDADGKLLFQSGDTDETHTLRYAADLLSWRLSATENPEPVTYAAHGTASESGNWHWIGTDPLGDDPGLARIEGVFSERNLANAATNASATATTRARTSGHLNIIGNANIRPADSATVEGVPGGDPDPLRVRNVHHQFDGLAGFVTCLEVEGGGSGGGLLGGLL